MKFIPDFLLAVVFACGLTTASACDLCGCYMPQMEEMEAEAVPGQPAAEAHGRWWPRSYLAVAEQFTHFGTLQLDGSEVSNPTDQRLDSSITQLVAGYNFTPRFSVQVNAPIIYRSFQRPEGFAIDHGTESGLGDMSLLGTFLVFQHETGGMRRVNFGDPKNPRMEVHEPDFAIAAEVMGGVKFPTGATSRLKEEFNEEEVEGAPPSGIHGHDLTLGSGSYDGIIGAQTSLRYKRCFCEAEVQYALRSEGAHEYEFADDLTWRGGPGYYVVRNPRVVVGVQCACTGEHKGRDSFRGEPAEDTGITSVFVGPRVMVSSGSASGEIAAEFPLLLDNTALQAVPDYRLRASLAFRF